MKNKLNRQFALLFLVCLSACSGSNSGAPKSSGTGVPSGSAGALAYSAPTYTVAQSAGSLTISVDRTGGSAGAVSIAYATASGTAMAGADYTAATGTLNWADGDTAAKTFVIAISNATPYVGAKNFTLQLSGVSGGATIGSQATADVTINGSAVATSAGTVALSAATDTVSQSAGTLALSVLRSGGSSGAASVSYSTADGTAAAGADYTASTGTLNWADGDATAKSFNVTVSKATLFVGSKTFKIALAAVVGATLGTPTAATVTINGGGTASANGVIQLSAGNYTIAQGGGSLSVSVSRTSGSQGAVTVHYATQDGTAIAATNYSATSGTLSWADGDATSKTILVPISNTTPFTGSKTFTLALANAGGGALLGAPSSAVVTINGSTQPGALSLSAVTYDVAQSAGAVVVSIKRTGGSSGAASVAYATANGTAVAGSDYTAANGTLTWAAGDTAAKTVSIPISNATPFSGVKIFTITLSGATGGATLSPPTSSTLTINGSAGVQTSQQLGETGAARLLGQATFGATIDSIAAAQTQSFDSWFTSQAAVTPTRYLPSITPQITMTGNWVPFWWKNVLIAPDQLRQRVAFALSEIFVVSGSTGQQNGAPNSQAAYYDVLVNNAFGNYRTLLEQVTLSPNMGLYLSMMRNNKPDPATGIHADENYAREIMQLFSIGLVKLNLDGTPRSGRSDGTV
jgi:hypothetical protein